MAHELQTYGYRWVRSRDGLFFGVCAGLGRSFGVAPWVIRSLWLVSIAAFGTGLLLYAVLALCLPREDRVAEAQSNRFLGVCARLSRRSGIEVGLVRSLAVLAGVPSLGVSFVLYLVLYFVMSDEQTSLVA